MNLTFVVLAGGAGNRFSPLKTNKTMFPFMGKPVIQHNLEMIERTTPDGSQVIVVYGEDNAEFLKAYQDQTSLELKLVRQEKALGMDDALLSSETEIANSPIVVLNAVDVVDDFLLKAFLNSINGQNPIITGKKMEEYFPGGYLETENNRVVSIIEKPKPEEIPSNLVNLVFHYFPKPKDFLDLIKKARQDNKDADDVYEIALDALMKEQEVTFHTYDGPWTKLKYPHMVLDMMSFYLDKIKEEWDSPKIDEGAEVADSAHISGPVIVERGAKIYENAVIKGPAYIGEGAIIGTGSLVRESFIEKEGNTGFGSEVARSYIGPRCTLHHNFIGDSVLESNINPGYGTTTANLRLDQGSITVDYGKEQIKTTKTKLGVIMADQVSAGAYTLFMPGVTVGANTQIFPRKTLYQAVGANQVVK